MREDPTCGNTHPPYEHVWEVMVDMTVGAVITAEGVTDGKNGLEVVGTVTAGDEDDALYFAREDTRWLSQTVRSVDRACSPMGNN